MGFAVTPLFRLTRAGFVLAREGVFSLVPPVDLPPAARFGLRMARLIERGDARYSLAASRLTQAFNRLGPSYVKLGQFLATRPDVVGKEAAAELSLLQDKVPPVDDASARRAVEEALGGPIESRFLSFGPALAAASIAQVHKATVLGPNGEEQSVAVKVLRPGVAVRFARDLESFYMVARLAERFLAPARRLRPVAIVDTLARSVTLEMDLRLEAAALSEMAENTEADEGFRVPTVDWMRTAKTVLTMEWIDGIKLSETARIDDLGIDRVKLAATILQSFLRHAVRDGFFHADMHQGNLLVEADGTLVALDFGITGRLNEAERRFLAEILYGFIRRDYRRVAEVHFEAGYVPAGQDVDVFAQALRAIGEPIRGHNASEISMARLLTQLFEVTEMFAMTTQPRLIMLQKTMVVVEGVARSLDPELDMWRTSEPVVSDWIARRLGPAGRLQAAGEGFGALARLVADLPVLADRTERLSASMALMGERGLLLDPITVEHLAAAEARRTRSGRVAMWIAAIALAAIAFKVVFGM
ncbi:2-octaprenylphenol hydroxylase [Pseudoxanthobacter soli DSM 19599]|uniref:2-octaprenylphenol hydroxylase n=1 Tax=Pseudoxanthobacter soli DSM 19599 TaxID=1123029 RepID=A0A1M7ZJS1_9HYPH|nr:2-polyprenylphenol 6-hydroxylase [Pseudoxanthobacter soli]SHO65165.1 2-octaprenylphenol hydroxylase [Pseudoxanthobacter soli DSM 19599]